MIVTNLFIDDIKPRPNARHRSENDVSDLAESIAAVGLINPIRVRRHGDYYEVIAGGHRLQAMDQLGWQHVPCIVVDDDDVQAEMAMITENLHRAELTVLERDEQIARWAELSAGRLPAQLAPAVLSDGRPAGPQHAPSGINAASRELGIDRTDAHRAVKVASLSDEAKAMARNVGLDDNRSALLEAARHTAPAEQVAALQRRHDQHQQPRGGIASRFQPATVNTNPAWKGFFDEFQKLASGIEAMGIGPLIEDAGPRRRALLNQRAASLIERLTEIVEGPER